MKKIIIAVSVVLVITVVACVGLIRYYAISVGIPIPIEEPGSEVPAMIKFKHDGKSFVCSPMFCLDEEKASEKQMELEETVSKDIRAYMDEVEEFKKPFFIECKYENRDGKTVITYKGEVTNPETGELEDYEKVFMYPFIVTKDIQNLEPAATNYFND